MFCFPRIVQEPVELIGHPLGLDSPIRYYPEQLAGLDIILGDRNNNAIAPTQIFVFHPIPQIWIVVIFPTVDLG